MICQGRLLIDPTATPEPGWLRIDMRSGTIAELGEGNPPERADAGDEKTIISPGFYDAHTHLPQFDAIGFDGMDLLDWLERVIFPAEMRCADFDVARRGCEAAISRMVSAGTLGCAAYLTSHSHSYDALCDAVNNVPMRMKAGVVLMDRNAPDGLINQVRPNYAAPMNSSNGKSVDPSINPRFAVSCSDDVLKWCGEQARQFPDLYIQTHLAESARECAAVDALFPDDENYTAVYDRHGLLTPRTLLAHCVHLSDDEWQLIALRKSVVVHCPGANTFLQSGVFDYDAAREHGVRLALGSDVAAGPDIAMPRVARAMIETAKLRRMTNAPDGYVPTPAEVWNIITRGNAELLGWNDCGRLEVGASADFLMIKTPFRVNEQLVSRLIFTWRDSYITHRIVNGKPLAA